MKSLIFGAAASLGLTAAVLIAPATAAPIPTAAGMLATQSDSAVSPVAMTMRQKMMMRNKMMMRQKMMMRNKMMMRKRMMMKKPMMKAM